MTKTAIVTLISIFTLATVMSAQSYITDGGMYCEFTGSWWDSFLHYTWYWTGFWFEHNSTFYCW